jgi:hypothetical protein
MIEMLRSNLLLLLRAVRLAPDARVTTSSLVVFLWDPIGGGTNREHRWHYDARRIFFAAQL